MLTPEQVDALRDKAGRLTDPVVEFLLEDIAERISQAGEITSTAAYEMWRAQRLGLSLRKVKEELRKRLKISEAKMEKLMVQAARMGYDRDIKQIAPDAAISFSDNGSVQQIVDAAVQMARADFTNLTQTIGFVTQDGKVTELTEAYEKACDYVFEKVSTGAQDYNSAIREAVDGLRKKGIQQIDYENGTHRSLEAAVRGNFMGSMGNLQERISRQNYEDLGCDGWEISAHRGSAPDHEPIQGKQYPNEEYVRLNNSLLRRIGTLNCGHSASPIIMGITSPQYSPEELEEMRQENETGITYNGKHYTMYEATQRQRDLERAILSRKRGILLDEKTGDAEQLQTDQIRLVILNGEYARFSKATGLRLRHERMELAGFGERQMLEAEKTADNVFVNPPRDLKILSAKVDEALSQYCERDSKWSGNTIIHSRDEMPNANGRKEWNCDISVRDTAGIKTVIHEHLHARSISYYDEETYICHRNMEEGSVELFAQMICEKNGVAYRASYVEKTKPLQIVNNILQNGNRYDFAKQLFDIPLPERYNWIRKQADDLIRTGKLSKKTMESLEKAIEYFRPKEVK